MRKQSSLYDNMLKGSPCLVASACLLGNRCRYDGCDSMCPDLVALSEVIPVIPVCPEVMGGLPVPRHPANIFNGDGYDVISGRAEVVNSEGEDVTDAFVRGAFNALCIARLRGAKLAFMKSRSPSCGLKASCQDKSSGTGAGVTAALFAANGIKILELDRGEAFLSS